MTNQETGLATREQLKQEITVSEGGIVLRTLDDLWRIAEGIHRAKMAPNSLDTVDKIAIAILRGAEVGFKPMLSVTSIAVINGVPGWVTKAARALIRDSGLLKEGTDIEEGVRHAPGCPEVEDGKRCLDLCEGYCRTWRKGMLKPREHKFSVADAKQAGLWNKTSQAGKPSPWILYHKRMLMHRAAGFNFDDCWGDVLNGMTTIDVLNDHPQAAFTREAETVTLNAEPPGRDPLLPSATQVDGEEEAAGAVPVGDEPGTISSDPEPEGGASTPEEPAASDPPPADDSPGEAGSTPDEVPSREPTGPAEAPVSPDSPTAEAETVDEAAGKQAQGEPEGDAKPSPEPAASEPEEEPKVKCEACPRSFSVKEEAHWPYDDGKYRCSACGAREPIKPPDAQ